MCKKLWLVLVVFTLVLAFSASMADKAGAQVYAAYVLLGQAETGETVAMARVIQDDSAKACPQLIPSQGGGTVLTMSERINPDPKHFKVQVCEALYPSGQAMAVAHTGFTLPNIGGPVRKVTVLGDTGCKPEKSDGSDTDVCGKDWWPFPALAQQAGSAPEAADLILHMGDYNYRGTPGSITIKGHKKKKHVYDAGDNADNGICKLNGSYYGQNSKGSRQPDKWRNWWLDLFQPAQKLLQSAPWMFARGNHELCSRAGPGWFYFLDANSVLLGGNARQLSCPKAKADKPLVFGQPYRVDLPNMTVLMLDSANACDSGDLHQKHYDGQFAVLRQLVQRTSVAEHTWYMSHRPLWAVKKAGEGVACKDLKSAKTYGCVSETLQTALRANPLPAPVHLSLAGHMHRFQSISFPDTQKATPPPQLVIGNGGVALASNRPSTPFSIKFDVGTGVGFGLSQFGYMDITLGTDGDWSGNLLGVAVFDSQHVLARCDSSTFSANGICQPVGD